MASCESLHSRKFSSKSRIRRSRARGSNFPTFWCPDFSGRDRGFPAGTGRETGQKLCTFLSNTLLQYQPFHELFTYIMSRLKLCCMDSSFTWQNNFTHANAKKSLHLYQKYLNKFHGKLPLLHWISVPIFPKFPTWISRSGRDKVCPVPFGKFPSRGSSNIP